MQRLASKVALVTGASRGIGRGIAVELGRAGATVYMTAIEHSLEDPIVQSVSHRLPTLTDVASEVERAGGIAVPVHCDHGDGDAVRALFDRIDGEQRGQLDLVVSNAFPAVTLMLTTKNRKFFDLPDDIYDKINNVGLRGHYLCALHAAKLMVPRRRGLIVVTSSPGGLTYVMGVAYGINKAGCDKLAADAAIELREYNVASVSLWPCAVRTELFTECGLITDEIVEQLYKNAQSLYFAGKCVVALASDPNVMTKSGKILTDMDLAKEYGLKDIDGKIPWCPITSNFLDAIRVINDARQQISLE